MGKTERTAPLEATPPSDEATQAPEGEVLALEVWLEEARLTPAEAGVLRVLYRGEKRTREGWRQALQEVLARPAR